jgi:hypothetical protein
MASHRSQNSSSSKGNELNASLGPFGSKEGAKNASEDGSACRQEHSNLMFGFAAWNEGDASNQAEDVACDGGREERERRPARDATTSSGVASRTVGAAKGSIVVVDEADGAAICGLGNVGERGAMYIDDGRAFDQKLDYSVLHEVKNVLKAS